VQNGPALTEDGGAQRTNPRQALLDAAEVLFGKKGVEGVSVREIAAAAGQRNTSAVQYHFGGKHELIAALIADRMSNVERLRQERGFAVPSALAKLDVPDLLRAFWQPLAELCGDQEKNWFVQFHLSYHLHSDSYDHPVRSDPGDFPASNELLDELHRRLPQLDQGQFRYRLGLVFMMFWAALARQDNASILVNSTWTSQFSMEETIKCATGALTYP
jgi:AcrR family transcriptional regulator